MKQKKKEKNEKKTTTIPLPVCFPSLIPILKCDCQNNDFKYLAWIFPLPDPSPGQFLEIVQCMLSFFFPLVFFFFSAVLHPRSPPTILCDSGGKSFLNAAFSC
eukprot:TRINITY_DN5825_c3_g1_i1.p1 TRINITY_DN5825_c3_g1~~TRINITY_DN5825_c3_g1_i1.p1  ORF type:complete len:103 (+),score=2.27 TRINITY_DN5825_c3_g1_i1:396-704(+)